jgi:Icc-related predicted phosphoesterase
MRIVAISDTHTYTNKIKIPDGDVLVIAGDITFTGTVSEIVRELDIIQKLPHKTKLLVEGNHDWLGARNPEFMDKLCEERNITLLRNKAIEIDGIKFYGSPVTPAFGNWAFMANRGYPIAKIWNEIPADTQVLITHGPPYGILDMNLEGENCGCEELLNRVKELKNLKFHVFGHLHESSGTLVQDGVTYINASSCTRSYKPTNPPITFEII